MEGFNAIMTTAKKIQDDLPVSSAKFKYLRQVLDTSGPFVDEDFEAGDMVRIYAGRKGLLNQFLIGTSLSNFCPSARSW